MSAIEAWHPDFYHQTWVDQPSFSWNRKQQPWAKGTTWPRKEWQRGPAPGAYEGFGSPGFKALTWGDSRALVRTRTVAQNRWDLQYIEKFGLLREKGAQAEDFRENGKVVKRHWDSDSEGLSDAESSTSKNSEERHLLADLPHRVGPANQSSVDSRPINNELLQRLTDEAKVFAKWAELRDQERAERQAVQDHLQAAVLQLWPHCQVELFGSSAYGLALPSSDLDLVVTGVEDFDPVCPLPHLARLAQHLQACGITEFSILPNAKVPIVKYCHPRARIWVDVSFTVLNSLKCVSLVKGYLESYPLLQPMIVLVKTLLRQNGLHRPHDGGLGSYAVVLLLICFLRLRASTCDIHNVANLGPLVVDFLRYFSHHGTECSFTPGTEEHPLDVARQAHGRLEIWDPLDSSNNVAYTCRRVEHIQTIFGIAIERLAWYDPRSYACVLDCLINVSDPNLRLKLPPKSPEAMTSADASPPQYSNPPIAQGILASPTALDAAAPPSASGARDIPDRAPGAEGVASLFKSKPGMRLGDLEQELWGEVQGKGEGQAEAASA